MIDLLRRTDEADVAVVLKESDDGQWHGVGPVQGQRGRGPGLHRAGRRRAPRAAGFTAPGTVADAIAGLRGYLADWADGADSRR